MGSVPPLLSFLLIVAAGWVHRRHAYAERFVRSIKFECLNRMIFIGQASLRRAIAEYVDHYHGERNHQGLDNGLIRAVPNSAQGVGRVRRKQRLGGMLNFYCREAV